MDKPVLHLTDEALELYTLHMLSGEDEEALEIHLLTCRLCQSALNRIDQEIALIRSALRELEARKAVLQRRTIGNKVPIFRTSGSS